MARTDPPRPDLGTLAALVGGFVAEREWERFHTPKNLAMSIAIESAELAELFHDRERADPDGIDALTLGRVEEESADVLAYVLSLSNRIGLGLDGPAEPPGGSTPGPGPDLRGRAIGVVVAAGELMELFQWLEPDEAALAASEPGGRGRVEGAVRKVMERLVDLTAPLGIDLNRALPAKMERNRAKYPVHRFRGRFG